MVNGRGQREGASPAAPLVAAGRWLPAVGIVIALWATLPPYTGPALNTAQSVEVADHVVPGLVVLAVSAVSLFLGRRPKPDTALLVAGLVVVLAGLWMTSTHVPLLAQASRGDASWSATLYHSVPSVAVLALGLVWSAFYWASSSEDSKGRPS